MDTTDSMRIALQRAGITTLDKHIKQEELTSAYEVRELQRQAIRDAGYVKALEQLEHRKQKN